MGDPFKITPGPNGPRLGSGITVTPNFDTSGLAFPVSNPELQWYISADAINKSSGASVGNSSSSTQDTVTNPYNTSIPSSGLTWQCQPNDFTPAVASPGGTVGTWTSLYGKTIYYINLGNAANYRTVNSCWDYASITSNGGFSWWCVRPYVLTYTGNYRRPLYFADPNTTQWNDDKYGGIAWYFNDNLNGVQNNFRPGSISATSTYYSGPGGTTFNISVNSYVLIQIIVHTPNLNPAGRYIFEVYNKTSESTVASSTNSSPSAANNTAWSIPNTNTVSPRIHCYYSSGNKNAHNDSFCEYGFANRPWSLTECTAMRNHLFSKYTGP